MPKRKSKKKKKTLLYIAGYLFFLLVIAAIMIWVTLPNVSKLNGSILIDRKVKNLKGDKFITIPFTVGEKNKNYTPLEKISKHLIHAVLVAEDIEFFRHKGFNFKEIEQAIKKNLRRGKIIRGGSTITQQLMKNVYLTQEKTFFRKFREALLTIKAEHYLTKERILELYLNIVEWGYGIYGVKMACDTYLNKEPINVTPTEAAYLAVLLPSPRRYSQAEKGSALEKFLLKKQQTVIYWMQKAGYLQLGSEGKEMSEGSYPDDKPKEKSGIVIDTEEEKELLKIIEQFQPSHF